MRGKAAEQSQRFARALGCRLLQPVAALLQFQRPRLAAVATEFQLSLDIASPCSLTQQFKTEAAIARGSTVAAEQLTKAALRRHHSLARGLLEQMSGKTLGAVGLADGRAIQQPGSHLYRQACL